MQTNHVQVTEGTAVRTSQLLERFPDETRERWAYAIAEVEVSAGWVLHAAGAAVDHVYFPTTALVGELSSAPSMPDAESLALACFGHDGMVGVSAALGHGSANHNAVVLVPGVVLRLSAEHLRAEMERVAATRRLALACVQAYIAEIAQSVICSQFHPLEQRLAMRLLQLAGDAVPSDLTLTQDMLALLLGERRERVNRVLKDWQAGTWVEVGRGSLRLLDHGHLAQQACACRDFAARARQRLLRGQSS